MQMLKELWIFSNVPIKPPKKKTLSETHIGTIKKQKHKCKQLFFK
jgi:hypothetical protein